MKAAQKSVKADPLERIKKGNSVTELLAQGDSAEIMEQKLPEGVTFCIESPQEWDGFELIYILEGEVSCQDPGAQLNLEAGSYLRKSSNQDEIWFQAETETHLLYISSQPSFHLMREEVEEFLKLSHEIESIEHMDGHCQRLDRMARRVGDPLGLKGKEKSDLSYGAYFHDLGKTKVPEEILLKEGDLTDREWEVMENHPTWGRQMMEEKPFLQRAAKIVEQTHERYDGGGYPHGLAGEEIALEARIISVVDAWDAMRSDRSYREALPKEDAIEELRKNRGTQFEPQVVDTFLKLIENKRR